MVAPWLGGASARVVTTRPGYFSLLAPWLGGAGVHIEIAPPAPSPFTGVSRPPRRLPVPPDLQALRLAQLIDDDELLLLMAAQIAASGLLH